MLIAYKKNKTMLIHMRIKDIVDGKIKYSKVWKNKKYLNIN